MGLQCRPHSSVDDIERLFWAISKKENGMVVNKKPIDWDVADRKIQKRRKGRALGLKYAAERQVLIDAMLQQLEVLAGMRSIGESDVRSYANELFRHLRDKEELSEGTAWKEIWQLVHGYDVPPEE